MSSEYSRAQAGRIGYVVEQGMGNNYVIVRKCPWCGKQSRVTVPGQGLWDWEHGRFIQDAMPGLSAPEREQVITGTHPACWEAMFPPEDERDG